MKRFLVPLVLLVLAACAQAPVPGDDALPSLTPLTLGSAGGDIATGLAKHSTGVYAVGHTTGNLYGTNRGSIDAFLSKYSTSGAVLWGRQFGTTAYDAAENVAGDGSNNAYVVGRTFGSLAGSRGFSDVFLRKYTSSGGVVWTRQFGSSSEETAGDVEAYGSSAVYVVGTTYGNLAGSRGGIDAFIRKYTSSGGVAWTRQFGTFQRDEAYGVAVDGGGNAYVVGYTNGSLGAPNGGESDMFIRRYNASGSVAWTKQLHYSSSDVAQAVAVTGSNVYLVGNFYYDPVNSGDLDVKVVKYTTAGTRLWEKRFGPSENDIVEDASADSTGVIFGGTTPASFYQANQGIFDGYVVKLNGSGAIVWSQQQGTPLFDHTTAVLARTSSEVYAAGYTYGSLGSTNRGYTDAFLRRMSGTTGATVWTDQ